MCGLNSFDSPCREVGGCFENGNEPSGPIECMEFVD
jgi:hypothetical protein